jgi:hypothetical protein
VSRACRRKDARRARRLRYVPHAHGNDVGATRTADRFGLHAKGGTEWYSVARNEIVADIRRVSHELALQQIMTNADGSRVDFINEALRTNFYGLLIFEIVNGQLIDFAEANSTRELLADAASSSETVETGTAEAKAAVEAAAMKTSTAAHLRVAEIWRAGANSENNGKDNREFASHMAFLPIAPTVGLRKLRIIERRDHPQFRRSLQTACHGLLRHPNRTRHGLSRRVL